MLYVLEVDITGLFILKTDIIIACNVSVYMYSIEMVTSI